MDLEVRTSLFKVTACRNHLGRAPRRALKGPGYAYEAGWGQAEIRPPRKGWGSDPAQELVTTKGLPGAWVDDLDLTDAPALVQRLAREGLWLEQEPIPVDPRTPAALEATL